MWDAIACTLVLAAGPTTSAVPAPVPDAIDGYYRDYDLVTAFSTPGERTRIAAGGAPASDARLARIAALMKRLEEQVDEVDPGMVMSSGRRWQETAARADLLRVASWRMDEAKAEGWATLDVFTPGRGASATLVGKYGSLAAGGRAPSVDELISASGTGGVHSTEVHHWTRVDGRWRRDAATLVFIAN